MRRWGFGQKATGPAELSDGAVSFREEHGELPVKRQIGRQSRGNEGLISFRLTLGVRALGVGKGIKVH